MFCMFFLLCFFSICFFFQAEDGIRDLVRSRGLGDVYKRQSVNLPLLPVDYDSFTQIPSQVTHLFRLFFSKVTSILPLSLIHI